jgi:hypothetical protein
MMSRLDVEAGWLGAARVDLAVAVHRLAVEGHWDITLKGNWTGVPTSRPSLVLASAAQILGMAEVSL